MVKKIIMLSLFALTVNAESLKDMVFDDVVASEVVSIYDGDTFRVNINTYPDVVGRRMAIRINGIDTPEMKGKCFKEKQLAKEARKLTVSMLKTAKRIELRNIKRGKYFRLLADVYVDDVSIGDELLKMGLAVKYDGDTKEEWCE